MEIKFNQIPDYLFELNFYQVKIVFLFTSVNLKFNLYFQDKLSQDF